MAALTLFYSYAHEDEALRDQLEKHLVQLQRQGLISTWHDRMIPPGGAWADEIDEHLETASIILLLVSPDFLASTYCYEIEMKRALERHQLGQARAIPIILRPCDWQHSPLKDLQCLPRDGLAITLWDNQDLAWNDVTAGIRKALESHPPLSASPSPVARQPLWNIPHRCNPVFTGREQILTDLAEALKTSQATALSQAHAISGLGGIVQDPDRRGVCVSASTGLPG